MSENNLFPRRGQIFQGNIENVRDTVARPSLDTLYEVDFSFGNYQTWLGKEPTKNRTQGTNFMRKMSLMCTQAEIPGTSFIESSVTGHHQGITEAFPNLRNFPPLNLVFYCDADQVILEVLESWMSYINPVFTSSQRDRSAFTRFNYPEDYKEIIHITKFERDSFIKHSRATNYKSSMTQFEFVNVWPTNLTSMRVAYGDSNVLRCSVQFAYDRFFTAYTKKGEHRQFAVQTDVGQVESKDIVNTTRNFGKNYKQQEAYFSSQEYKDKVKREQANTAYTGQQYGPMASDIKLKENIIKVDNSPSGINIYEWNYIGKSQRYRGVLAQELLESHPEAVTMCPNGFLGVYYGKIDVKMEAVKPL